MKYTLFRAILKEDPVCFLTQKTYLFNDVSSMHNFQKRHKRMYAIWVVISVLTAISMLLFLIAPLFMY